MKGIKGTIAFWRKKTSILCEKRYLEKSNNYKKYNTYKNKTLKKIQQRYEGKSVDLFYIKI